MHAIGRPRGSGYTGATVTLAATQGVCVLGLGKSKLLREGAPTQGVVIETKRQVLQGGNF
jgi:hypothetical protein